MGIKDDDLLPDERALLEGKPLSDGTDTQQAAGGTDGDGGEPAANPDAGTDAPSDTPADGAVDDEGAIDQSALEAVASDETAARPTYDKPDARDYDTERKTLRASKADIQKKWNDGELSDEEYAAKTAEVDDQLDALLVAKTEAQTIESLNKQAAIQEQQKVLNAISTASKLANELDYTDEKVAIAYDKMLRTVAEDPDNAGKSFAELAQLAHVGLCAVRGIQRGAPKPKEDAKDDAKDGGQKPEQAASMRAKIPTTLGSMPAAAAVPVGNDALTSLAAIDDPDAAEAALASMPASQRTALLRSTMPDTTRRH